MLCKLFSILGLLNCCHLCKIPLVSLLLYHALPCMPFVDNSCKSVPFQSTAVRSYNQKLSLIHVNIMACHLPGTQTLIVEGITLKKKYIFRVTRKNTLNVQNAQLQIKFSTNSHPDTFVKIKIFGDYCHRILFSLFHFLLKKTIP